MSDEGEEEEGSEGDYEDEEEEGEEEGEKEGNCAPLIFVHCVIAPDARAHADQLHLLTIFSPGPPVHKKRKTENGANGKKVEDDEEEEEGEEEEEEPENDGEGEDEDVDDTAETSGPAAAAAKAKGGVVPKESALAEVDDAEEEE